MFVIPKLYVSFKGEHIFFRVTRICAQHVAERSEMDGKTDFSVKLPLLYMYDIMSCYILLHVPSPYGMRVSHRSK